jgi:hypothetical protein
MVTGSNVSLVRTAISPQSSSASRFTAGAFGFLLLIQCGVRPELYRESFRFETMPFEVEFACVMEDDSVRPPRGAHH